MEVMRQRAHERGAVLIEIGEEDADRLVALRALTESDDGVGSAGQPGGLEGQFQNWNQAIAVNAAKVHLQALSASSGYHLDPNDNQVTKDPELPHGFAEGLSRARLRGRCETLVQASTNTTWLIDRAHTAESLREVARWFAGKYMRLVLSDSETRFVLVFNQQDRDAARLLTTLHDELSRELVREKIFDLAVFTRNDLDRTSTRAGKADLAMQIAASDSMRELAPATESVVTDNVADAVAHVQNPAGGKVVVLATGSLHLVGGLLRTLEPEAAS
jgi:folylpolyglutamate synthase